jgi:hypothetical protein
MTSIVIGGLGKAIATGITKVGIGIIPGVIGQGKNFIGRHQVILVMEALMVNQVDQGMEALRVNQVMEALMVNQVDQGMEALRVSPVVPVEADLRVSPVVPVEADHTVKCMEERRDLLAKQVDPDLRVK